MRKILNPFVKTIDSLVEYYTDSMMIEDDSAIGSDDDGGDANPINVLHINYLPTYLGFEDLEIVTTEIRAVVSFSEYMKKWQCAESKREKNKIIQELIVRILRHCYPNFSVTFNQNKKLFKILDKNVVAGNSSWYHNDVFVVLHGENKIDFSYKSHLKEKFVFLLFRTLGNVLLHLLSQDVHYAQDSKLLVLPIHSIHSATVHKESEIFSANILLPFSFLRKAIINIFENDINSILDTKKILDVLNLPIYEGLVIYQIENNKERIKNAIEKIISHDEHTQAVDENEVEIEI